MYKNIILISFLLLSLTQMLGQEKKISIKKVSPTIKNYVRENYPNAKHIRYYEKKEGEKKLVECDFKLNKRKYALTFIEDNLFEIERSIDFKNIPNPPKSAIKSVLAELKTKKVLKCEELHFDSDLKYEIKIKTEHGNFFEVLFDKSGQVISKKEIISNPIPSQF